VSWSIQALVMLWIAGRLQSEFLRHVAYALYAIVLWRFCFIDLRTQYFVLKTPETIEIGAYLWLLLERFVMFGVPIASIGGAYRLLSAPVGAASFAVDRANDVRAWVREQWAVRAAIAVAVGMLFLYLHVEIDRTFGLLYPSLRLPLLTVLWAALCVYLLIEYVATQSKVVFTILTLFGVGLLLKLFWFDLPAWHITDHMFYESAEYALHAVALRFLDFGVIIGFFTLAFCMLAGRPEARQAGVMLGSIGLALFFIFSSLELNTCLRHYVEDFRAGGISILWSLFALGMILCGIWKRAAPLRLAGLVLFAVVAAKVFFVDLERLSQFYKIVAFILLGLLVLSGSFVYLKYRQTFAIEDSETSEGDREP
jgi:hypothetical protein